MVKEFMIKREPLTVVNQPELPLGSSVSTEFDASNCRKRKKTWVETRTQISIDLHQLNDPLPLDWEQCLDLLSGRIYYMNRRSLNKSWVRPKEEKLDLDLNSSTQPKPEEIKDETATQDDPKRHKRSVENMIAAPCFNCHLLVMLCRSSPSCPNCKFVHQLPPLPPTVVKSLKTLSLLN